MESALRYAEEVRRVKRRVEGARSCKGDAGGHVGTRLLVGISVATSQMMGVFSSIGKPNKEPLSKVRDQAE